jgi:hypothetical protein
MRHPYLRNPAHCAIRLGTAEAPMRTKAQEKSFTAFPSQWFLRAVA